MRSVATILAMAFVACSISCSTTESTPPGAGGSPGVGGSALVGGAPSNGGAPGTGGNLAGGAAGTSNLGGGGNGGSSGGAGGGAAGMGGAAGAGGAGTTGAGGSPVDGGNGDARSDASPPSAKPMVYVGGETGGIWLFSLDETTGTLTQVDRIDNGGNASFFAFTPDKTRMYSTVENLGKLSAYSVAVDTGKLALLNQVSSTGTAPTHVSLVGPWLMTAHYQTPSGLAVVFSTDAIGKLVSPPADSQTPGKWSHQIVREKTTGKVFVPCKGADQIVVYDINETTGKLTRQTAVASAVGAGPRHIDFHPSGQYAYVMNENDVMMVPYKLDATAGLVANGAPQLALPAGTAAAGRTGAEVIVAPSGTFVYGSSRGGPEDSLVIFPIDGAGKLGTPTFQPSGGQVPRNFTVDPEEKFVIVANQTSKNVVVFRMNKDTGALTKLTTLTLDQTVPFVTLVRYPN